MTENRELTGGKAADAAQKTGEKIAPDAGEQKTNEYRKLIEGEFKELFNADIQNILRGRLKKSEGIIKKAEILAPALRVLAKKYALDENDAEALAAAILSENDPDRREGLVRAQYEKWLGEAAEAQDSYPDFRLEAELCDDQFRALLKSGVPVRSAYELIHRQELLDGYTKRLEESITKRILAGSLRPKENAIAGNVGAPIKSDVAHMSKSARQELIRRVQKGERIEL